nr:Os01g0953000 [Ipomoea batatas]
MSGRGDGIFLSEVDLEDLPEVDAVVDDENSDVSEESLHDVIVLRARDSRADFFSALLAILQDAFASIGINLLRVLVRVCTRRLFFYLVEDHGLQVLVHSVGFGVLGSFHSLGEPEELEDLFGDFPLFLQRVLDQTVLLNLLRPPHFRRYPPPHLVNHFRSSLPRFHSPFFIVHHQSYGPVAKEVLYQSYQSGATDSEEVAGDVALNGDHLGEHGVVHEVELHLRDLECFFDRIETWSSLLGTSAVHVLAHGLPHAHRRRQVKRAYIFAVLDDSGGEGEDRGDQEFVIGVYLEAVEDKQNRKKLDYEGQQVAEPEVVVFNGESGDGVRPAEVEQEKRRPESDDAVLLVGLVGAVVVDEADGEGGYVMGKQINEPEDDQGAGFLAPFSKWRTENQKNLEGQASHDGDLDVGIAPKVLQKLQYFPQWK